jgi:hypothetical protein
MVFGAKFTCIRTLGARMARQAGQLGSAPGRSAGSAAGPPGRVGGQRTAQRTSIGPAATPASSSTEERRLGRLRRATVRVLQENRRSQNIDGQRHDESNVDARCHGHAPIKSHGTILLLKCFPPNCDARGALQRNFRGQKLSYVRNTWRRRSRGPSGERSGRAGGDPYGDS